MRYCLNAAVFLPRIAAHRRIGCGAQVADCRNSVRIPALPCSPAAMTNPIFIPAHWWYRGAAWHVCWPPAAQCIGKIGKALHELETEASPLQKEITGWCAGSRSSAPPSVWCLFLYMVLPVVSGCTACWPHSPWPWTLLPEEYPVVLAVFMAMGAWRIFTPPYTHPIACPQWKRWAPHRAVRG